METSKNARKKVLFIIHTLGGGGAEAVLVNLVNNLCPNKYDITVMTLVDTGELKHKLASYVTYKTTIPIKHKQKVSHRDVSGSLLNKQSRTKNIAIKTYTAFWKYFPTKILHRLFVREKYDVEIAFLEGICAKFVANSPNKDSKKYAWIHVDLEKQDKSSKIFKNSKEERRTYEKFDKIVCVSKDVKRKFIKKYGADSRKVIVRYNPIDADEIIGKAIRSSKQKKDELIVTSIGRLNRQKGYDRLLRVAKRLIDDGEQFSLQIIGEGTSKQALVDYLIKNNLGESIKLLGFKSNPYGHLRQSDIYVCSSRAEGFSTSVSEALILGLPIVTTNCAGMKEILGEHNEYGIITKNSENALYEGLKSLLSSAKLRSYYRDQAAKRSQIFDIRSAIAEIEELLDA